MNGFDRQQWQRFWQVAQPYWASSERFRAIALLVLLLALSLASSSFLILETLQRGEVFSSLAAQDGDRFWRSIFVFLGVIAASVPLLALKVFVQSKLSLYWRRWLTDRFLSHYFNNQTFYHLNAYPEIDNPDQRIESDIRNFTQQSLVLLVILADSIVQLIGFVGVLWLISPLLMVMLAVYAFVGTVLTAVVFGQPLIRINSEQLKREADFRFGLVRVRENSEAVAFYQGQTQELQYVWQRFMTAYRNFDRLIRWQFSLTVFQNGYQYLTFILPFIILAPRIFLGELEVGTVTQSQAAFERIGFALGLIITQFNQLSAFIAGVDRLSALTQFAAAPMIASGIVTIENSHLTVHRLTLQTPDCQTILIQDLSFQVLPHQSLLIVGASGVGKSSLLRSIAGLWASGTGTIARPQQPQILFIPQRPYLVPGSLRQQLLYPNPTIEIADVKLLQLLQQVQLQVLAMRFGLDAVENWSQVLSIGEQQRLAFARLLLTQPQYAILDEATSALDVQTEKLLYDQLQATSVTYISVGHRSTLLQYHQMILELSGHRSWRLISTADAQIDPV